MMNVRLDDLIDGIRTEYPDRPLEQLTAAVLAADHLQGVSDHLIGHFVDQARHSGASWTEIGGCLGVTKQAAQQRFVPKDDPNMFARFTAKARSAVVGSQEAARDGLYDEIHPDHLVLGLLEVPDCLAVQAIRAQGITVDQIRTAALESLPEPPAGARIPALIPFSGPTKKALELTLREALRLGHNYVGTEHLLLALLGDGGLAGSITALHVDAVAAEAFVTAHLAEPDPRQPSA